LFRSPIHRSEDIFCDGRACLAGAVPAY
jgi:hypothetical protein